MLASTPGMNGIPLGVQPLWQFRCATAGHGERYNSSVRWNCLGGVVVARAC